MSPSKPAPAKTTSITQTIEAERYREFRTSQDFYERSLVGPAFYFLGFSVVFAIADYYQRWPWLAAFFSCAFLGLWWLRYRHLPPSKGDAREKYVSWFAEQWLLLYSGVFLWGLIPAFIGFIQRQPDTSVMVSIIATVAFATAASHVLDFDQHRARICILLLLLPSIFLFALPNSNLAATSITLGVYGTYLVVNLRRSALEYDQQIALEIELINSRTEVARLSMTDTLTDLPNRLSYESAWPQAWHQAARQRDSLALLMLDLDHFKHINDKYGHLAGDACLRHFAKILQKNSRRESDLLARIGGEEFVVILPSTNDHDAYAMAEKLRLAVAGAPCLFENSFIPLAVSIGVGTVDWNADTAPTATFNRVDHACYLAKDAGRNRVIAA